jgi:tRNA pseudouridine13 synthase
VSDQTPSTSARDTHDPRDPRDPRVLPRAYFTADIPGIGGRIKERPEDFLVEELPLYEPCGSGEHIYLLVQKRNLSTFELVQILARHFNVPKHAVGYAGLKDKVAITQQVMSIHVPGRKVADFPSIQHERLTVLWAEMHTNKLRPGHLKGNGFSIRMRGVSPTAVIHAKRVLERLAVTGVPNRIGEQRFGHLMNNHIIGRALLMNDFQAAADELLGPNALARESEAEAREHYAHGDFQRALEAMPGHRRTERRVLAGLARGANAKGAILGLDEATRKFYLTSLQSAAFNGVLDDRMSAGSFDRLTLGDLAFKHENRAVFAVDEGVLADPTTATRLKQFEISPSGPMWGAEMMRATGSVDDAERTALSRVGIDVTALSEFDARCRHMLEGQRRPLRVPISNPDVEGGVDEHGAYVRVAFELPRGSFATVVLREIMKPALGEEPQEGESEERA